MLWLLDYVSQVSSRLVIFCFDIVNYCAHEDNIDLNTTTCFCLVTCDSAFLLVVNLCLINVFAYQKTLSLKS